MSGFDTLVKLFDQCADCGIRIVRLGRPKVRLHPVFPKLSGGLSFGVHNNSLVNGVRALVERVFRKNVNGKLVPPPPCTAKVIKRLRRFKVLVLKHVGEHRPITREKFLEFYVGRRRDVYARAVESLARAPLTERDFRIDGAFVKAEKHNFTSKPDGTPRAIQPRNPRYNVEVGVYLRPLEHSIYHAIAEVFGGPTVMKGYSAEGVARHLRDMWDGFKRPVAFGLDASRFDQHVRPEMLQWEHSVYAGCFPAAFRKRLRWLLSGQIHNRGYMRTCDGLLKYAVHGSRMSGDMNTALGNCLIMCALVHTLAGERGVRVRLANNGDDCVVICEQQDVSRLTNGLKEWFLDFGFDMKMEPIVRVFEQIEFCQAHPVHDGERWVMVRDPRITLSKDACCVNRDYAKGAAARQWLYAVGECGLSMTGGIPVVQDQYVAFMRSGQAGLRSALVRETGMAMLARGCTRVYREPTVEARVSFWLAFGIAPAQQMCLERHFQGVAQPTDTPPCYAPPRVALGTKLI